MPALRLRRLDAEAAGRHARRHPRDPAPPRVDEQLGRARALACRRCFSRLPHVAIEHQRRRPDGSTKSQPQRRPGHARTAERRSDRRNSAARRALASTGSSRRSGRIQPSGVRRATAAARSASSATACQPSRRAPSRRRRCAKPLRPREHGRRLRGPGGRLGPEPLGRFRLDEPGLPGPDRRARRSRADSPSARARPSPPRCCRAQRDLAAHRERQRRRRRPRMHTQHVLTTSR